ncbi:hypothetical protein LTR70_008530 [Exophiala xenobiotica]|nr:hypothetical protein LTR70_008530 [Exophiala xenobiotica]
MSSKSGSTQEAPMQNTFQMKDSNDRLEAITWDVFRERVDGNGNYRGSPGDQNSDLSDNDQPEDGADAGPTVFCERCGKAMRGDREIPSGSDADKASRLCIDCGKKKRPRKVERVFSGSSGLVLRFRKEENSENWSLVR